MNLAVIKFLYNPDKPEGMPDNWIWEVRELGESTELPEGAGWQLMSLSEYNLHISNYQTEYDQYLNSINIGEPLKENFKEEEYDNGLIQNIIWYQNKDESDNLINKAREVTYVYIEINLKETIDQIFDINGRVINTITTKYYTENNKIYTEVIYV